MKALLAKLSVALAAAVSAVGCAGADLQPQIDALARDKDDLQRKNTALEGQLAASEAKCGALERDLSKRAVTVEKGDMKLSEEMTRKGISLKKRNGDTVIDIPSDVFFASGQSTLSKDGEKILHDVGLLLKKEYAGKMLSVEGHADSDPIRSSKGKYHCNWELSFERAHSVGHFLIDKCGMDPKHMAITCYGEFQPQDAKNKSKNRRVELVVSR